MNWESPLKIKMRPSGNATNRFALEDNLGGLGANIGDHLADQGAHDALLEPRIGLRSRPDGPEITGQSD